MRQRFPVFLIVVLVVFAMVAARAESDRKPKRPEGAKSSVKAMPAVSPRSETEPNPVPVPPGPFDLQICFELAVLRSETLGLREEDVRVAQARYWQAIGAVLPKIHSLTSERVQNSGGGGSSTGTVGSSSSDGSSSFFSGAGGGRDSFSTRINVKQPIFSGFREFYAADAAEADIASRKYDKQRALQLLYLDVADVFYQILMYEGDIRILYDVQGALQDRVSELEKRVKLGKSRTGELLQAQSDLADNRVAIEQTRGLGGASRELLAFLTGVASDKLNLKDTQTLPTAEVIEVYLRGSGDRPDVLSAIEAERAARKQLSAAKGEHWPTISAEANYYIKQHPQSNLDWNIFLTCDIPLFEGGIIEAKVNEQKSLVQSSRLSLEQLRRTTDKDIRTAYNNFIASIAQMLRLRDAVSITTHNFQVQSEDYKLGVVNNLDVLEALKQMHEARQRLVDAEMEARDNLIRLHVAAGRAPEPAPQKKP